ncbi:30S ribosomal protein S6, partial [Candidatus Parcubacteria bacterium]
LYIVAKKYTEEESKKIHEEVKKIIQKHGAKITDTEEWGKKKLAYPIQHFNHGYYFLIGFELAAAEVEKVNKELKMKNEVLRHLIMRRSAHSLEEREKSRQAIKREQQRKAQEAEQAAKEEKKRIEEEKKARKEEKKIDLEELDKKLDKILDADDLINL